ncbi:MAG: STAS domain-containing protein [Leptospiraceae bacterium]|nr:STAS domain-containing protein [Leptospiraceae bacterium]MCB1200393.1 STAS domain-containing protein [Leptospiraceae bacterium]
MVDIEEQPDGILVKFNISRLDIMKSSELLRQLSTALERAPEKMSVDVSELDFIDSAVLGVFVRIHDLSIKQKKKVYFINLSKYVKNMFDSTRIGRVLNIQ